ncbi:MAG: GxxExxY protein [Planctomycetaceae bacterium]|jgi:GxxExxY protein|nr:GxxExxY protein [Planctomycetaceae bacterium]
MDEIIFKEECYAIQGAAFEVYREIGCGFAEQVYQECFAREMCAQHIPFESQKELRLQYKGEWIDKTYRADFVCYNTIIVEIKAVSDVAPEHKAQVLNYLRMSETRLGLLINFGHYPKATVDRILNSRLK